MPLVDPPGPSLAWAYDNVVHTSVGVDIGSSTSHLRFSRLRMERIRQGLSSRFVLRERTVLWQSPVMLTPFRDDGLIDADALRHAFEGWYGEAGLVPERIDTGAVILTGVALERENAKAVAELLAGLGGNLVTAAAGQHLEAILAAHGSGAVARSRGTPGAAVHLDVGGGTAKVAVVRGGAIEEIAGFAVGGRLLVHHDGVLTRVEAAGQLLLDNLGIHAVVGDRLSPAQRTAFADRAAELLVAFVTGGALPAEAAPLALTPRPRLPADVTGLSMSGGVARFLDAGAGVVAPGDDVGRELAVAIVREFARSAPRLRPIAAAETIRATVVGASEFVTQVSGNTFDDRDAGMLPVRNLPVARPMVDPDETCPEVIERAVRAAAGRLDLADGAGPLALALPLAGPPRHATLRRWAAAVHAALPGSVLGPHPLVVVLDVDLGASFGRVLREVAPAAQRLLVIDGIDLHELDFIDVGAVVRPANVVTVVVKSLAFGSD